MPDEPPKIKHTLLILGILMLAAGFIGVVGLRLGIIQGILGDSDPFPGIGTAEPMGHIVSMVPFVLGMVTVAYWGIRNDPIYHELEKAKEEEKEEAGEEEEVEEEEALEKYDWEEPDEKKSAAEDGPAIEKKSEWEESGELPEPTIVGKPAPGPAAKAIEDSDEIFDSIDDLEKTLSLEKRPPPVAPRPAKPLPKDGQAEQARVERCRKMLSFARILDEDREKLEAKIDSGVPVHDFTEEVKRAVERRKKRDEEKARTAEQKAAIIEEEVLDELMTLEEEMDDEDLEDMILSGIDELEQELKKNDK